LPVSTTEFRNGLKIEIDGEPYVIVEFQHVKPGKGGAFVRTKMKSLKSGNVIDRTFRSGEKVDVPELEEKTMQYLYAADKDRVMMDTTSYEQVSMSEKQLGDSVNYLGDQGPLFQRPAYQHRYSDVRRAQDRAHRSRCPGRHGFRRL